MNDAYKMFLKIQKESKRKETYSTYDREELLDLILEQEDKLEELDEIIIKAIEYIENNELYEDLTDYSEEEINFIFVNDLKATKELLSILRGEDK